MTRFTRTGAPSRVTTKHYVKESLRREILAGSLRSGSRLIQSQLAAQLDVSTTPVREALHDLAAEGLVKHDPHRGAVVSELTGDELREVFELRRVLEPMVLERAIPRLGADQVEQLEELCTAMEEEVDVGRWALLNREFHDVFMHACGWPRLASMVGSLYDSSSSYLALALQHSGDLTTAGNSDHRRITEAAKTGDVASAVACVVEHMNMSMAAIQGRFRAV